MKPPIFPPFKAPLPALDWHARATICVRSQIDRKAPDDLNGAINQPKSRS